MPHISVIICSHNPRADYLRRVLSSLEAQTLPQTDWELVLIDNASRQLLSQVWDLSWHPNHVHVREDELGLTQARLRGIKETSGSLLLFLDDDNVLPADYLERAAKIEQTYPHLGVFGAGVIAPEFEVEPPPEVRGLLHLLALRDTPRNLWSNNAKDTQCIPWGAGLCVTRSVATAYVHLVGRLQINHLLGRRGCRLFSGDDDVFSWACADTGKGFGVLRELRLVHLINGNRLNQRYFIRLVHDHAHSHAFLDYLLAGEKQHAVGLRDVLRILLHGARRGLFSMRCQWAAATGIGEAARVLAGRGARPIWEHPKEALLNLLLVLPSAGELCRILSDI